MELKELCRLMKIKKDIEDRKVMLDTASKLYNTLLKIYKHQFNKLKQDKKKKTVFKNRPKNLRLKTYDYEGWLSENKDGGKKSYDVPPIPPLEGEEKVKEGTGIKIMTPNKLFTIY